MSKKEKKKSVAPKKIRIESMGDVELNLDKALITKNLQDEQVQIQLGDGTSIVVWVGDLGSVHRFRDTYIEEQMKK